MKYFIQLALLFSLIMLSACQAARNAKPAPTQPAGVASNEGVGNPGITGTNGPPVSDKGAPGGND